MARKIDPSCGCQRMRIWRPHRYLWRFWLYGWRCLWANLWPAPMTWSWRRVAVEDRYFPPMHVKTCTEIWWCVCFLFSVTVPRHVLTGTFTYSSLCLVLALRSYKRKKGTTSSALVHSSASSSCHRRLSSCSLTLKPAIGSKARVGCLVRPFDGEWQSRWKSLLTG